MSLRPKYIEERLADLEQERKDLLREKALWAEVDEVRCPLCEKHTPIDEAIIIEKWFYIEPYSCMAGDYWDSSGEYLYHCAQCNQRSRAYTSSYDYEGYGKVTANSRIKTTALDETRVQLYFLIKANKHRFGERLISHNEHDRTLKEIRQRNAERRRRF